MKFTGAIIILFLIFQEASSASDGHCYVELNNKKQYSGTLLCQNFNNLSESLDLIKYQFQSVRFENSSLELIPNKTFSKYKLISHLYLNDTKIKEIQEDAFFGLIKLETLHLQRNQISKLHNITFNSLYKLKTLDLSENQLTIIENNWFHNLSELRTINLYHNKLFLIENYSFSKLIHLEDLDLSYNYIEYLSELLFVNLSKLQVLNLSVNKIQGINFESLPPSGLRNLNLSENSLGDNIFGWNLLENISTVDLSNNNVSQIENLASGITNFILNFNNLRYLNSSMLGLSYDLLYLDFSENQIQQILKNTFQNLTNLQVLILTENKLSDLPAGIFLYLSSLRELRLSHNKLENLKFGTFKGLNNLTNLYLDNNNLHSIQENSFYVLRNLKTLYLEHNQLKTLNANVLLLQIKSLKFVELNSNKWLCNALLETLGILNEQGIKIGTGSHYEIENIDGIACKEDHKDLLTTELAGENEEVANLRLKNFDNKHIWDSFEKHFLNTSIYKFFNDDYRTHGFLKNFEKGFKNTNFIRYFNKGFLKSKFFNFFENDFEDSEIYGKIDQVLNKLNTLIDTLNKPKYCDDSYYL